MSSHTTTTTTQQQKQMEQQKQQQKQKQSTASPFSHAISKERKDKPPLLGEGSWLFPSKEALDRQCPSFKDGISREEFIEKKHRAFYFLSQLNDTIKLRTHVLTTAMSFLHRFYTCQSMKNFHYWHTSIACYFIALKAEERWLKIRTLLQHCHDLKYKLRNQKPPPLDTKSKDFFLQREALTIHERLILLSTGVSMCAVLHATEVCLWLFVFVYVILLVIDRF
eukprot:m.224108 g.224108  ORF g.224108 m.224108 type:complete len:223 (+) comp13852_c2_seq16:51-719(+)